MEIILEDYPQNVQNDIQEIAREAMATHNILVDPADSRSPAEIASSLPLPVFNETRTQMLGRVMLYHQEGGRSNGSERV